MVRLFEDEEIEVEEKDEVEEVCRIAQITNCDYEIRKSGLFRRKTVVYVKFYTTASKENFHRELNIYLESRNQELNPV